MAEPIYIHPEDDISSVTKRLASYEGETVEIVVPSGARILQNIVDAYLLRDAAASHNKDVTIVTNDVMGKVFAERAGITVTQPQSGEYAVSDASTARMSDIVPGKGSVTPQMAAAKRSKTKKATSKKKSSGAADKEKASRSVSSASGKNANKRSRFLKLYQEDKKRRGDFDELKERTRGEKKKKKRRRMPRTPVLVTALVLVVALGIGGVVFGAVLPQAEITIFPVREASSFTLTVQVDRDAPDVDIDNGIIPGEVLEGSFNESGEFSATGVENVESKARGTITVFNEYSSQPQNFIPSRFESEDGRIFWTTQNITVPGAEVVDGEARPGSITVEVEAAEAGEAYNVGPGRFVMPALRGTERFDGIYATSNEEMVGGMIGEAVVVTDEDVDRAIAELRSRIAPELEQLRRTLPESFTIWDEAYSEELAERDVRPAAGTPTDTFTASITLVVRAIAFDEQDLEQLLNAQITNRLSEEQTILPPSKNVSFLSPPLVSYQAGTIEAQLQVTADVIENININSFRGSIAKKNRDEIRQVLPSFSGIERVEIALWPFWVRSVPGNTDRIDVSIFGMEE